MILPDDPDRLPAPLNVTLGPVLKWIAQFGAITAELIIALGKFSRFSLATVRSLVHVNAWGRHDRITSQLYFVGTTSIPVLAITGGFIGMILAIEGYLQFASIGQENRLGGVINVSLVKQLGPVLAAVMLAGRVGCALTAELGSMRVTEQLDAMRAMAADPYRVLVAPRVVACVLMIPVLTIVSNLCGFMGGWVITTKYYGANEAQYWRYTQLFTSWFDVVNGLSKAVVFGAIIGLVSCYKGFFCRAGAEGVGRATTESFVTSFMLIIMSNLVMAKLFNDLYLWIFGSLRSVFG
ncbi:MAG: ABC transporter permease [Planctomycetota bacterium]|nr:ABC transporter permease [Planctomycetota bacterium]